MNPSEEEQESLLRSFQSILAWRSEIESAVRNVDGAIDLAAAKVNAALVQSAPRDQDRVGRARPAPLPRSGVRRGRIWGLAAGPHATSHAIVGAAQPGTTAAGTPRRRPTKRPRSPDVADWCPA